MSDRPLSDREGLDSAWRGVARTSAQLPLLDRLTDDRPGPGQLTGRSPPMASLAALRNSVRA